MIVGVGVMVGVGVVEGVWERVGVRVGEAVAVGVREDVSVYMAVGNGVVVGDFVGCGVFVSIFWSTSAFFELHEARKIKANKRHNFILFVIFNLCSNGLDTLSATHFIIISRNIVSMLIVNLNKYIPAHEIDHALHVGNTVNWINPPPVLP